MPKPPTVNWSQINPVRKGADLALYERMRYWGNGPGVMTVWLNGKAVQIIGLQHSQHDAPYALRKVVYTDIKFKRVADVDELARAIVELEAEHDVHANRAQVMRLMRKIKRNSEC